MKIQNLLLAATCALGLGLGGCTANYSHTDISNVSTNDANLTGTVTAFKISVSQGNIVTAHIAPFNNDEKPMVGDVQSEDPTVLQVVRAYGDKNYAFIGVKPGKTTIEFLSDGVVVARIDSDVPPQTPQ